MPLSQHHQFWSDAGRAPTHPEADVAAVPAVPAHLASSAAPELPVPYLGYTAPEGAAAPGLEGQSRHLSSPYWHAGALSVSRRDPRLLHQIALPQHPAQLLEPVKAEEVPKCPWPGPSGQDMRAADSTPAHEQQREGRPASPACHGHSRLARILAGHAHCAQQDQAARHAAPVQAAPPVPTTAARSSPPDSLHASMQHVADVDVAGAACETPLEVTGPSASFGDAGSIRARPGQPESAAPSLPMACAAPDEPPGGQQSPEQLCSPFLHPEPDGIAEHPQPSGSQDGHQGLEQQTRTPGSHVPADMLEVQDACAGGKGDAGSQALCGAGLPAAAGNNATLVGVSRQHAQRGSVDAACKLTPQDMSTMHLQALPSTPAAS